jgi:hypothetical protein
MITVTVTAAKVKKRNANLLWPAFRAVLGYEELSGMIIKGYIHVTSSEDQ